MGDGASHIAGCCEGAAVAADAARRGAGPLLHEQEQALRRLFSFGSSSGGGCSFRIAGRCRDSRRWLCGCDGSRWRAEDVSVHEQTEGNYADSNGGDERAAAGHRGKVIM